MALKNSAKAKKAKGPVSPNAFAGQTAQPTEKELESVLGASNVLWKKLIAALKTNLNLDGEDWHSSGVKYGWALRLQKKGRNIVYLGPRMGSFMAAFVLGDKAVAAARQSDLPPRILKMIAEARRYAEGTAVRLEVGSADDLAIVSALARIKVEH